MFQTPLGLRTPVHAELSLCHVVLADLWNVTTEGKQNRRKFGNGRELLAFTGLSRKERMLAIAQVAFSLLTPIGELHEPSPVHRGVLAAAFRRYDAPEISRRLASPIPVPHGSADAQAVPIRAVIERTFEVLRDLEGRNFDPPSLEEPVPAVWETLIASVASRLVDISRPDLFQPVTDAEALIVLKRQDVELVRQLTEKLLFFGGAGD